MVQDAGGVLVGCTVGKYGAGIMPTAASSRITYGGTSAWLINANKMTVRTKFRTGVIAGTPARIICKAPNALNDNQFFLQLDLGTTLSFYVANAAGDFAQAIRANSVLASNTDYLWHCVYDGSLAAGSRAILYNLGSPVAATISGTIPTSMRASSAPLTVFNFYGSSGNAPPTDFVLYDFAIWQRAFSAAEVAADAALSTFATGGP